MTRITSNIDALRMTAVVLLLINGIGAFAAGLSFMADPSGGGLGLTPEYLTYSPFSNYLIPGIILFTVNGIFSMLTVTFTIRKLSYYPLSIILQGAILLGWIIIQIILLKFIHPMHFTMGIIGIFLVIIGVALDNESFK